MDGSSEDLFSDPRLTEQQHGGRCARDELGLRERIPDRRACRHDQMRDPQSARVRAALRIFSGCLLAQLPDLVERALQRFVTALARECLAEHARDDTQLLDDLRRPFVFRRCRDDGERTPFSGHAARQRDGNNGGGPDALLQDRGAIHRVRHLIEAREAGGLPLLQSRRDERNGGQHPWIGKRPQRMLDPEVGRDDVHVGAVDPPQHGVIEPQALSKLAQAPPDGAGDRLGLDGHKLRGHVGDLPLDAGPASRGRDRARIEPVILGPPGTGRDDVVQRVVRGLFVSACNRHRHVCSPRYVFASGFRLAPCSVSDGLSPNASL